jgi:putative Mn2+ efflux pump MntP
MELVTSLFVATGLAMDAFAVSLGIGTTRRAEDLRSRFRLAFHFGLFQGLMTILGWLVGSTIANYISAIDHWIAMGLLTYVGVNMVRSGLSNQNEDEEKPNPSRGRTLIILCIATSLDAMAVGLGMAMVQSPIFRVVCVWARDWRKTWNKIWSTDGGFWGVDPDRYRATHPFPSFVHIKQNEHRLPVARFALCDL